MTFNKRKNQKGQALLVVVLVMVVALTIGLSAISRSITNVKTSTEEANSAQALAAAEAGVAKTVQTNVAAGVGSFGTSGNYNTTSGNADVTSRTLNGGNVVIQDEGVDLWLVPHDSGTRLPNYSSPWPPSGSANLNIYWADTNTNGGCDEAALEVILVKGPTSAPTMSKYAYDPCTERRTVNHFSTCFLNCLVDFTIAGKRLYRGITIPVTNGLIVRIIPLYKNANIAVAQAGGPAIPTQGTIITSTGTAADVQRKLNVFQAFSSVPVELFAYGIFVPK